jgi:hypothetical protein
MAKKEMKMRVKILDVSVETVSTGKKPYKKATVAYMSEGQARTQSVIDFANPDVFKKLSQYVGKEADVTVTKNAGGYNQWAAIADASNDAPAASSIPTSSTPAATNRVTGSNYETPAERAVKQVYIVKQSSLSAAVALAASNKEKKSKEEIVADAQFFVDFVFDNKPKETGATVGSGFDDMADDIPY